MFSYFDFLFREEKSKDRNAREFGFKESHWLQHQVKADELEKILPYDDSDVNQAIVNQRQDVVILIAQLNRSNIILRSIRFILIIIVIILLFKL